jgi:hypothetical protein
MLESHIRAVYSKIEETTKSEGVYRPLNIFFAEGTPSGQDGSFCYSDEKGYHFGVYERGVQRLDYVTPDLSEITYHALANDIFWMAVEYESSHRIAEQDFRRLLFQKELQYWNTLGVEYVGFAEQKIKDALQENPFVD